MKKFSDEKLRNDIIGLGKSSIRKNYYRSLIEKQKALEEKNDELRVEVNLRIDAERKLNVLNEELEGRIVERTTALDATNQKLQTTLSNLEKSYDYLIESEKLASLSHLVNGISHELNTPLGVSLTSASYISELIQTTIEKFNSNQLKRSELVHTLQLLNDSSHMLLESIDRMTELTGNFRKVAMVQDHYQKFEFSVFEYFEMIIKSMQSDLRYFDSIEVNNNCNEELIIDSYPGIYSQLITTFLKNTFLHGFNKAGGKITIDFYQKDNIYYLKYYDDGKGMDQSLLSHVFEPFFSTKMNNKTSGLGLFAAYNLVISLEGSIKCYSTPKTGFTIEVSIPSTYEL